MGSPSGTETQLERTLGFTEALMIGVGTMIGAGIFVLPGPAAGVAGPAIALSFVIGGVIALVTTPTTSASAGSSSGGWVTAWRMTSSTRSPSTGHGSDPRPDDEPGERSRATRFSSPVSVVSSSRRSEGGDWISRRSRSRLRECHCRTAAHGIAAARAVRRAARSTRPRRRRRRRASRAPAARAALARSRR